MTESTFISKDGLNYIINNKKGVDPDKISDKDFLNKDGLKIMCKKMKQPSADISGMSIDTSKTDFLSEAGLLYLHCISKK